MMTWGAVFRPFLGASVKMGANSIDWLRSVYFSLFGSSLLTFCLKLSTLDANSIIPFAMGIACFLFGLIASVLITNRFKKHEKNYDTLAQKEKLDTEIEQYYIEQEHTLAEYNRERGKTSYILIGHVVLHLIWMPALLFVAIAGYVMESKASDGSFEIGNLVKQLSFDTRILDSTIVKNSTENRIYFENLSNSEFMLEKLRNESDSLKLVIAGLKCNRQRRRENK
jgi:hypothetical protein